MQSTDQRDAWRLLAVAVLGAVNGFADRIGYDPLSGLESTAVLGVVGALIFVVRKKQEG